MITSSYFLSHKGRSKNYVAEPAGVIANGGFDENQELNSKGFLPLAGALCTV